MPDPIAADKAKALKAVQRHQKALDGHEAKATQAATERSAAMLTAQQSGATYEELVQATGLSKVRVSQVLSRERHRTTEPTPSTTT